MNNAFTSLHFRMLPLTIAFLQCPKAFIQREDPHTFYGNHKCGFPNGKIGYLKMNQPYWKLSLVTSHSFTAIQEKKQNLMDFRHALQIPRVEAPRWVWHWVALGLATDCTS